MLKKFSSGSFARRPQHRGVSMIEVLVSIVIASIGLLALAGVNASSVRYTKMSQYRSTATQLANDIGERMRANKAGRLSYALTANFSSQASVPVLSTAEECSSYGITCSAAFIANFDLKTWRILIRDQLPEGSAYVDVATPAAQNAADVWVVWRDPAVASTDEAPAVASECPTGLTVSADPSVRCSYFRISL